VQETEKIWMNGELVDWADAKVHVGVHGLHYGTGVFEGIRCYDTPKGPAVFRLDEHLKRLHNSAKLLYMQLPYAVNELKAACNEVIGANGLPECYLRPIAFYGYGELGVSARGNPVEVVIMSWPWAPYLGTESLKIGIRAKISSWQRVSPNVVPHVSKATGVYLNSMLAVTEANNAGYDEAILLTSEGFVADGSGENIFIVRDGVIYTPDLATGILPGITRDTIKQIAQDLGYTVVEKSIIRSDLYLADEAFMCGTAAEVTPLRSIESCSGATRRTGSAPLASAITSSSKSSITLSYSTLLRIRSSAATSRSATRTSTTESSPSGRRGTRRCCRKSQRATQSFTPARNLATITAPRKQAARPIPMCLWPRPRSRGDCHILLDPFDPRVPNDLGPAGNVASICDQGVRGMSLMGGHERPKGDVRVESVRLPTADIGQRGP